MAHKRIDYGIDLGTTNSAIARIENGKPKIIKSDTQKDTTPSCVHYNKKGAINVGDTAYNNLDSERKKAFFKNTPSIINAFEEFKRTMGRDKLYKCKNMKRSFSSEELSAEVLKTLKGYVRDEEINSIVITVPAKFLGYQIDATKKAAELAGFQHCILLQEPIAASMAYGIEVNDIEGKWLVFDFGGGTFDAALMKVEEGIMKVVGTEGDNHLGGKNLDMAIVDDIIIPYLEKNYNVNNILIDESRRDLLRNALKRYAEEIKINFSHIDKKDYNLLSDEPIGEDDNGNEMEIDLNISRKKYESVVKPIFQRAIDLSLKLLNNNNLTGSELTTILLIGGPTLSETLRDMVRKQISKNVNVAIDPMTAVAKGAALFASTKYVLKNITKVDKLKIQLKLIYQADTVETEEKVGVKVLRDETESEVPEVLFIELNRQDKGWSSGRIELKDDAEILDILLEPGKSNGFEVVVTDRKGTKYLCEPDSFSIIQGFKIAGPTLPFDLCIEAIESAEGKQQLMSLKGLEKNQPLPAKGKGVFQTQKDVRPGEKSDQIRIPIYEGVSGTRAIYNDYRGKLVITGKDLPNLLPKGSEVELTIDVDESRIITVSASFPYLDDFIIDIKLPEYKRLTHEKNDLERELTKAQNSLKELEGEYPELDIIKLKEIKKGLNILKALLLKGGTDDDTRDEILDNLRTYLKEIDVLESDSEWPKVMQELIKALEHLEYTNEQFGDDKTEQIVKQLQDQAKFVIEKQDLRMAKDLTGLINDVNFAVVDQMAGVALEISFINNFEDNFETFEWKNRSKARQLINEANGLIAVNRVSKQNLRPIISQLTKLLPQREQGIMDQQDDDVLIK